MKMIYMGNFDVEKARELQERKRIEELKTGLGSIKGRLSGVDYKARAIFRGIGWKFAFRREERWKEGKRNSWIGAKRFLGILRNRGR